MATLSSSAIDELWKQLMSEFSGDRTLVPFNKNQFRQGLVDMDGEMETAEVAVLNSVGNATVRAWLIANQAVGRYWIESVERVRKEEL